MKGRNRIPANPNEGFFVGLAKQIKLIWRLLQDGRVPLLLKLIPFGALLYLIFPLDIPGPFDDFGVVWLGATLFVEMCPPDIVAEHRAAIEGIYVSKTEPPEQREIILENNIIDAKFTQEEQEPE